MSGALPDPILRLAKDSGAQVFLLDHHLEAARRLTALFWRARLNQRVTMSYDPTRIGNKAGGAPQGDMALSAAEARAQLNRLAQTLPKDCWAVLSDVCFYQLGLQDIETQRQWPRRGAKLVLRIALEHLAQRWGINARAVGEGQGVTGWLPDRPAMFAD
ncbi:hypothetical protein JHC09_07635 [Devosia sp. MC532]|uniref:DUF6456 domain-containing protein n=1 Tax=Devosia sp. MC532 TaxID=2799788 RepID=UPI0018F52C84|nr:DUF6456 domain-containing protein [Devosia sp. MC532]MBJ7577758.1 hypothetical protein [Devosia sp. MC532]